MLRIRSARLIAVASLIGLFATALSPGVASAVSFSAKASIAPKVQYVGDSAGKTFTLKVKNTGTVRTIGAVRVTRPTSFWTVSDCPTAPAGWSRTAAANSCTYLSPSGTAGNIARNHTATFSFTAKTAPAIANRAGVWSVSVSALDNFSDSSWIKQAGAMAPGLNTKTYSFEITGFGVADSPATVGDACPALSTHAPAGVTGKTIVVCGTNHTNSSQTLKNAYSKLNGTLISAHGPFSSSPVAAGATDVVLGNWSNVAIAGGSGSRTIAGRVGAFSGRTSPPTLASGYTLDDTAPVAVDDPSYSVNEDDSLIATSVLANDTDPNSDPLTAFKDSDPTHAQSFVFNSDGTFTYTPVADFHGTDTFTYHANDGALDSNVATVTITVNSVNDAPIAVNDAYVTNEDTPIAISAPGVLGNDSDADGDPIHVSAIVVGPAHGSLVMNVDGSFQYTPDGNFNGSDSFTYKANDGTADSNVATVNLTVNSVNDAPVASDDEYTTYVGGFSFTEPNGLRTNVTDPDGDTQTISKVSDPSTGTLTLNSDGSFSYNAPSLGDFSFTWKSNDGTVDSNTATFTIHVIPVPGGGGGGGGGGCMPGNVGHLQVVRVC